MILCQHQWPIGTLPALLSANTVVYTRQCIVDSYMKTKQTLEKDIRAAASAVLIVNTYSRRGERLFFRAIDQLTAQGITIAAAYPVRDPVRLPEVINEAISRGHQLVVVGGGDGTISSIVDSFAYQDVVLGLLPLGTGNSFARTLGIPLSLEGAVDVIAHGKVADVDLGKVGEDYFARQFTTRDLTIETTPVQYVDVDGEITTQTPVRITLAPEALNVMVPQAFEDR